jgi:hypothetical protein
MSKAGFKRGLVEATTRTASLAHGPRSPASTPASESSAWGHVPRSQRRALAERGEAGRARRARSKKANVLLDGVLQLEHILGT